MLPMNFLHTKADYIVTGEWAGKAHKEAKLFGEAVMTVFAGQELQLPADRTEILSRCRLRPLHHEQHDIRHRIQAYSLRRHEPTRGRYVQRHAQPPRGLQALQPDLCRRPEEPRPQRRYSRHRQESMGGSQRQEEIPTMMKYKTHIDKESLFNTPPCVNVFAVGRVFK